MRTNPLKAKLAHDEPVFGPMILDLTGPGLPQIFANAGADFIVYDMEAGCLEIGQIKLQCALARGLSVVPIVNIAWHDTAIISRPLDCGAMGLMIPMVQSEAEAEAIARAARYPPSGTRGVAFGIAHDGYSTGVVEEQIKAANERILTIAKIETTKGVEAAEAIMAVPGIDVAFVGHMDLSTSLGIAGQYEHPKFIAAVENVMAACSKHGKHGGCLVTTPTAAKVWLARGFRLIIYSTDVILIGSAFKEGIAYTRGSPFTRQGD
jgi:2-keto-3-deoxy-L-rhamnonate aldolase RhmA